MVGAEALSLQGIPREKLLLNRESSKQLIDLSGNAMTSTAVGAAILAALTCCSKIFGQDSMRQTKSVKSLTVSSKPKPQLKLDPDWLLTKTNLKTEMRDPLTASDIRLLASASIRLCSCETLIPKSSQSFQQCRKCGHTSCVICGNKPRHEYQALPLGTSKNGTTPIEVEKCIRHALPARLTIRGLFDAFLEAAVKCDAELPAGYSAAIKAADAQECHLVSIKRDRGWSVIYKARSARLVLTCQRQWDGRVMNGKDPKALLSGVILRWKFYAIPNPSLPANSVIRKDLLHPVARLSCSESIFDGQWEIRIPIKQEFTLEVLGRCDKVDSWEKRQGVKDPLFKDRLVWSVLEFRLPSGNNHSINKVPKDILGEYELLQECGTACGSLHIKRNSPDTQTQSPIFFFLDPSLLGNASNDSFVFATQHDKLGLNEAREILAKVNPLWRTTDNEEFSEVACEVVDQWVPVGKMQLEECAPNDLQAIHLASSESSNSITNTPCDTSGFPVIWCEFPMTNAIAQDLGLNTRTSFELIKDQFSLSSLGWLIKTAGGALPFADWQSLPLPFPEALTKRCSICAPQSPGVVWQIVKYRRGFQIRPSENRIEACNYERTLKAAPEVATAEIAYQEHSTTAALKINLNILTLIHKAVAAISESRQDCIVPSTISWRVVVDHGHDYPVTLPPIKLKDCQNHDKAPQPPCFLETLENLNRDPWIGCLAEKKALVRCGKKKR